MSVLLLASLGAGGCQGHHDQLPGDRQDHQPSNVIAAGETVHFTGTEPFWGGEVSGSTLTYRALDDAKRVPVFVTRFAGRGGVSFTGKLADKGLALAISPQRCSDGMSDRSYPFMAMLQIGEDVRQGCAWTPRQPFSVPAKR